MDRPGKDSKVLVHRVLLPLALVAISPQVTSAQSTIRADFNGDGYADLAVGVPGESIGRIDAAGAVNVLYGSAGGIVAVDNQFWNQNKRNVINGAEVGDGFGFSVAAGDFNGDGFADLAVGVPGEDVVHRLDNAGAVQVLYGSASGLSAAGNQFWTQDSPGVEDQAEDGDLFGQSLAVGDFNGDGFADLAVGVRETYPGNVFNGGGVNVLYGSAAGLFTGSTL